ncbi:MAG: hypothetical protein ACOH5I_03830 [Oligoflexus sp.]
MLSRFYLLFIFSVAAAENAWSQDSDPQEKPKSSFFDVSPLLEGRLKEIQEFREQRHVWDRAVRGFRRDHNFSLNSGIDMGIWSGHVGTKDQAFELGSSIPFLNFQYSFHLVLLRDFGLGYFVGTKTRLFFFEKADDDAFQNPRIYGLPGAVGGLTWNLSPVFRVNLGLEGSPVRIEKFHAPGHSDSRVSATAQVISYRFSGDFFFRLGSGLNLEYELYRLTYDSANGVRIRRRGESWSLGWTWHLI